MADLVKNYIEHAKRYLKLYERLINKYPYKRFSIVENFLPTGYSMPTYTLLGQEVVRLPFIPETSLGHEILHQWFGNSVYIDYREGELGGGTHHFSCGPPVPGRKRPGTGVQKRHSDRLSELRQRRK